MKKLLSMAGVMSLLAAASVTHCAASAQALRYLKMAGTAAWQDMKHTAQWVSKNPYKTTAALFAANSYAFLQAHRNVHKQQADQFETFARESVNHEHPIAKTFKDTCSEHGIHDPLILILADQSLCDLQSVRHGNRMFILITNGALQQMLLDLEGKASNFKMKHWKTLLVHEIKHLKKNDSQNGIIAEALLRKEEFKTRAFNALSIGTGIHIMIKGMSFVPKNTSPRVHAAFLSFLAAQSFIATKALHNRGGKSTIFTDLANAWSRWYERRADDYVRETAFKTKNPELLDNFAEWAEIHLKIGTPQCPAHPPLEERVATARTAAAELREEMRAGKPAGIVVTHDCSPF